MIGPLIWSLSAVAATLSCPAGPPWTRERQQRPPIVEAAPVVAVRLETAEADPDVAAVPIRAKRDGTWVLDPPLRYALVCSYQEGADSIVIVDGLTRLRVGR